MSQNQSVAAFRRSLDNRFNDLKAALQKTMDAFAVAPSIEARKEANAELYRAAKDLRDLLHDADRPKWLGSILVASKQFNSHPGDQTSRQFINAVAAQFPFIQPIVVDTDASETLDFDALFQKQRDEGTLPQLFDKLIELASKIIESGEVESITALDALKQLVEILKANRNGSYLAARQSLSTSRYLKHLANVVLEKVPVLKELREAYDRTNAEAEAEFERIEQGIRDETLEAIKDRLPRVDRLPSYAEQTTAFLTPLALPAPPEGATEA